MGQNITDRDYDDVEYPIVELGQILEYKQPTKYLVKSANYKNEYRTPVLTAGKSFLLGYTDDEDGIFPEDNLPVIIFDDFTTATKYVDFSFKVKSSAMKILKAKDNIDIRFIFYMMQTIEFSASQHKRHWISEYSKIKIPLPPLNIQKKLANTLDKFTSLEAELEAELEARKKQYEHYRAELLTFGDDVERIELQHLFDIKNGYTPSKKNPNYWTDGTIPWFRMEDIRKNGRVLSDSIQHVTPEAVKRGGLFPASSIIIATTATIGEHALITVDSLANQRFTFLSQKVNRSTHIDMKFFFYYCFVLSEWCKNNTNSASFASVEMTKFKKFKVPVPKISEQKRIVSILDKFDALVNDISIGLPAELKARRKQYEYYRDKLLTFNEYAS